MASRRPPEPAAVRQAVAVVVQWLRDESIRSPDQSAIGEAVRLTARALAAAAPGSSVEVRVPPFVAVQCISGPRHTRGTPPNVVETDARTWLLLATGLTDCQAAVSTGRLLLSGARAAEIEHWLPMIHLHPQEKQEPGG